MRHVAIAAKYYQRNLQEILLRWSKDELTISSFSHYTLRNRVFLLLKQKMKVAKYFNPILYEIIDLSFENGKTKKIYTTLSFKAFEHSIWETVFPTGFKDATFNFVLRMYHCYCHLWSNEYLIAFFLQYLTAFIVVLFRILIIRFKNWDYWRLF